MQAKPELYLLLHNIRSVYNVGAIFRTAEAAGVKEIILFGYTPTPIDRFGRVRNDLHKAALGAENMLPWRAETDIENVFVSCEKKGIDMLVVEQTENALPYTDWKPMRPTMLVVGNEREGVPLEVCVRAKEVLYIPMAGQKESLNVSVATGIVLFSMRDGR